MHLGNNELKIFRVSCFFNGQNHFFLFNGSDHKRRTDWFAVLKLSLFTQKNKSQTNICKRLLHKWVGILLDTMMHNFLKHFNMKLNSTLIDCLVLYWLVLQCIPCSLTDNFIEQQIFKTRAQLFKANDIVS